ncbi:putative holin-like toxin [Longirhabdus pacifica]|nr:putative holin-like toxin [Longirhabdus pacifica]
MNTTKGQHHKTKKEEVQMTVYEAMSLMVSFGILIIGILAFHKHK